MRTVLNILNFVLGGFATTLGWLLATLVSIVLIFTLPLTRSCWEITKLSLVPYGNEAIHVDELNPAGKNVLLNTGGTVLNIFWLIFFGWWLCLMHMQRASHNVFQSLAFLSALRTLKLPLLHYGRLVVAWYR
ncbi:putative membrane protein [Escherichia coli P12b]|nr:putative membrane protein [Escherichia coli P12b]